MSVTRGSAGVSDRALADGAALPTSTAAEFTAVPKVVPSRGRTCAYQASPLVVADEGTVVRPKKPGCSTLFLNQRTSVPLCASESASA